MDSTKNMKITTNNKPRRLIPYCDLPRKAQEWFDYVRPEDHFDNRFFRYKREWHDAKDFMRCPNPVPADQPDWFAGWHGYASDSYFSGIVIKYCDLLKDCNAPDEGCVIVGWYCC